MDKNHRALYFSRAPIPFTRVLTNSSSMLSLACMPIRLVLRFSKLAPAPIEAESLEQLRAMWYGYSIQVLLTDSAPPPGVDTAEDLERVRQVFAQKV
jgi:3-deoxy-manno-octulosonate cytidylyltransferase (CMP-KDO synthetase)